MARSTAQDVQFSPDVDPLMQQLLLLKPDYSVGSRVHSLYVNMLQGATPGSSSARWDPSSFRNIFFPQWQAMDLTVRIPELTGLQPSWWADFAAATLCQSMYYQASHLKPELLIDKINSAVSAMNQTLKKATSKFYAHVFGSTFAPFRNLLAELKQSSVGEKYKQALISNSMVYKLWYSSGQWNSPDWDMFHHYIKLMALGHSDTVIDTLIALLSSRGLPIPAPVQQSTWRSYTGFFLDKAEVDHADIDAAANKGIVEKTPVPEGGIYRFEGNSFDFTDHGQPGNAYHQPPGGSCFSGSTLVLMADGTSKPISAVAAGDTVATPDGSRTVGLVAKSLRGERPLYTINGLPFGFTASHPFAHVTAPAHAGEKGAAAFASVDPHRLRHAAPTLAHAGIERIRPGTRLRSRNVDGVDLEPLEVRDVTVVPAADDMYVYDLLIDKGDLTFANFFVRGDTFLLAAPEMPVIAKAPYAVLAGLGALSQLVPCVLSQLRVSSVAHDREAAARTAEFLYHRLPPILAGAFAVALEEIANGPPTEVDESSAPIAQQVSDYIRSLNELDPPALAVAGALFEVLAGQLGLWMQAAAENGWRCVGDGEGDVIAVSLFNLDLAADGPLRAEERVALRFSLHGSDAWRAEQVLDADAIAVSTPFHWSIGRTMYFPIDPADRNRPLEFAIEAYLEEGVIPLLRATGRFIPEGIGTIRFLCPHLGHARSRDCGRIALDVRMLTSAQVVMERSLAARWTEQEKATFARRMGLRLGQVCSAALARLDMHSIGDPNRPQH